ncbi:hypothetical protein CALVIDRAFT_403131 [Calocera viscosa TUFC12733]|uniref:Uncharacterized protein n=1 Tax=Calocera viscosa (strain TUFC12733) TaxID=1330018 RepID=A0A167PTQ4_CALVF|nr:hypothetical protein CALVIDRAFT_403131 [Calocera viscosa TUFC12733]
MQVYKKCRRISTNTNAFFVRFPPSLSAPSPCVPSKVVIGCRHPPIDARPALVLPRPLAHRIRRIVAVPLSLWPGIAREPLGLRSSVRGEADRLPALEPASAVIVPQGEEDERCCCCRCRYAAHDPACNRAGLAARAGAARGGGGGRDVPRQAGLVTRGYGDKAGGEYRPVGVRHLERDVCPLGEVHPPCVLDAPPVRPVRWRRVLHRPCVGREALSAGDEHVYGDGECDTVEDCCHLPALGGRLAPRRHAREVGRIRALGDQAIRLVPAARGDVVNLRRPARREPRRVAAGDDELGTGHPGEDEVCDFACCVARWESSVPHASIGPGGEGQADARQPVEGEHEWRCATGDVELERGALGWVGLNVEGPGEGGDGPCQLQQEEGVHDGGDGVLRGTRGALVLLGVIGRRWDCPPPAEALASRLN